MPVFEFVDFDYTADFLVNYDRYETVSTPDFTGDHVCSFVQLRDIASHLQSIHRAFPGSNKDDVAW